MDGWGAEASEREIRRSSHSSTCPLVSPSHCALDSGVMHAASLLALGFLLGMRHALDADHVVAVSAIVARHPSPRRAAVVGMLWGLGHSVTVLLLGGAITWFKIVLSERATTALELGVAAMLVALGFANLRTRSTVAPASAARPLLVGMMHGLAGSAAIALLVLATVADSRWALGYLALFGIGTMTGMTLATTAMAVPMAAAASRFATWPSRLVTASGVASIAVGFWLAWSLLGGEGTTG